MKSKKKRRPGSYVYVGDIETKHGTEPVYAPGPDIPEPPVKREGST